MKKIAIIGASGEIGFRLVEMFHKSHFVKCIVRNKEKKNFGHLTNIELIQIEDIGQTRQLATALKNSDAVINVGYIWFAKDIHKAIEQLSIKPKHILFTGSTGIYTKLPSKGAQTKRDAEFFIRNNYTIPWTIIRPTMIYGHCRDRNISRMVRFINKFPVIPLIGKGNALIQPVFIDDLLKAYHVALLNEHFFFKDFNIGAKHPVTNKELFAIIASSLNKKRIFISISSDFVSLILRILSLLNFKPISQEQVLRFQENKDIDLKYFIDNFKYIPRPVEEGIAELIKRMKSNKCLE